MTGKLTVPFLERPPLGKQEKDVRGETSWKNGFFGGGAAILRPAANNNHRSSPREALNEFPRTYEETPVYCRLFSKVRRGQKVDKHKTPQNVTQPPERRSWVVSARRLQHARDPRTSIPIPFKKTSAGPASHSRQLGKFPIEPVAECAQRGISRAGLPVTNYVHNRIHGAGGQPAHQTATHRPYARLWVHGRIAR